MKKLIIVFVLIVMIFISGCIQQATPPEISKEQGHCISSGGTVTTAMCCLSSEDFPRMDLIGACGCSPENSHEVKICDCGEKVWNGDACITQ
ncbi:MAG: hypothetical protein PHU12_04015 [Candidatus Aenigmarchaeota archaeon]|nr:hypothetical protein [Candidatus Aenigmarchaeota archaeon]